MFPTTKEALIKVDVFWGAIQESMIICISIKSYKTQVRIILHYHNKDTEWHITQYNLMAPQMAPNTYKRDVYEHFERKKPIF